jgi:hypothetical protein
MPALDMAFNQITLSLLLPATDTIKCLSLTVMCVCKMCARLVWALPTKSEQRIERKEMNHQSQQHFLIFSPEI